jgi:hypothetical protein
VEYYNDKIAKNAKVELVHYTLDSDKDGLEKFMLTHSAPWPAVDFRSLKRAKTLTQFRPRAIPNYLLIDANGNKVAEGMAEVKAKIAEVSGDDS